MGQNINDLANVGVPALAGRYRFEHSLKCQNINDLANVGVPALAGRCVKKSLFSYPPAEAGTP
ncbi:MAG: hypothetical protein Q8M16_13315, partial [Pirellulaceae bacterium]|nr:hypothetical protein [Pirellulaceae bacterium]